MAGTPPFCFFFRLELGKSDALKRAVCLSSFIISYGALPRAVKQGSSLTILEERDTRNQTRKEANEKSEKRIRVKTSIFGLQFHDRQDRC